MGHPWGLYNVLNLPGVGRGGGHPPKAKGGSGNPPPRPALPARGDEEARGSRAGGRGLKVHLPLPAAAVPIPVIHAAFIRVTLFSTQKKAAYFVLAVRVLLHPCPGGTSEPREWPRLALTRE